MNNNKPTIKKWWLPISLILIVLVALIAILNTSQPANKENTDSNSRIISLIPSVTQSIYYMQAQDKLVGCTNYCQAAKADNIEVVASVMKPNIEKIVSLRPDIVLASGLTSEKDIETLRKFGIRVEVFIAPRSFDGICSEFIRLGKLVGHEDVANKVVEEAKEKTTAIKTKFAQREIKPKIFMQIGASPIYTVFPDTFMDDYITFCGGTNIAENLTSGAVGREFVVSSDPDYIFIATMGIVGEEEMRLWQQFTQMKATANNKIFILDSDIACQPSPITFVETLEIMNKLIVQ